MEEKQPEEKKKLYNYWMSCIKRAQKKQPVKKWEEAQTRFTADPPKKEDRPFVNDLRKLHEASMSFLDQQDATFKVSPAEAFISDPDSVKRAECDSVYLKRVWREQKCQKIESRKLNDAVLKNNGFTLAQFDVKKWMPSLRYLAPDRVLLDPDCGGIEEEADWTGYYEDVSIEEFRSWHRDLPKDVFESIVKKGGSVLTDEQREEIEEGERHEYRTVRVYHVFARNSAAIREPDKESSEEVEVPRKDLAEELQLDTPRRYMQYINEYNSPLVDKPVWPLNLDHDEFPISHLQFNQVSEELYGFTDYQQMERLDSLGDDIILHLGIASFWAAVTKFLGTKTQAVSKEDLDNFLNEPRTSILLDMLTSEGEPKLKAMERGKINPAQMQLYDLISDAKKEASALNELLSASDIQSFKDVTALSTQVADANMHQRVNRRLGGPWGYEPSIAEDAIKMLEVAHQLVPRLSIVATTEQVPTEEIDPETGDYAAVEQEVTKELPWPEAVTAIAQGGDLIKLGVDAIVGPELAKYWPYGQPPEQWKLNIKVIVEPGTTRSVTRQQQAAVMKQLYLEVFLPFYTMLAQYSPEKAITLMRDFIEMIGRLAQVPNVEGKLIDTSEIQEMIQQMMQRQMEQQQMSQQQEEQPPQEQPQVPNVQER